MIIVGIDPGHSRIGYGIISDRPTITLREAGIIEPRARTLDNKFLELHQKLSDIIRRHKPHSIYLETLFFSKNKKTALAVAEARGVIRLTSAEAKIPLHEISPMTVKRLVGGSGAADKLMLMRVLEHIFHIAVPKGPDDISDAIAIAVAGALHNPLYQK